MQPTEFKRMLHILGSLLSKLKPEHAALAGLCAVAFTHWGDNIFNSQAFVFAIVALIALAIMTRDVLVGALVVYMAGGLLALQVGSSFGWIKYDLLVQEVDSLTWIMVGLVLYVVVRYGTIPIKSWMKTICVLATALSLLGLVSYFGKGAAVATLGNQNFLGAFLAISAFSCYELNREWKFCLIPILCCLLATKTTTAITAFLIGTGYYFLGWSGVFGGGILGIGSVILLKIQASMFDRFGYSAIFKVPDSIIERTGYWIDAVEKISSSWNTLLFGVGPGIYWRWGNMLHSEYAYIYWNLGLIGLALAALYIIRSCREINNNKTIFAMFIAVLVDSIGNHLMRTPPTGMLAMFVFGLKDRLRIPYGSQKFASLSGPGTPLRP